MSLETRVILPAAYKHLTADDWTEIGNAFADNGDPRFSADTDEEFRQLFVRILNLVPEATAAGPGTELRHPSHGTASRPTVVIVPGLRDHVSNHWQTLLGDQLPGSVTVPRMATNKLSCAVMGAPDRTDAGGDRGPGHPGRAQRRRNDGRPLGAAASAPDPRCAARDAGGPGIASTGGLPDDRQPCSRAAGCPCRARASPFPASWRRAPTTRLRAASVSRNYASRLGEPPRRHRRGRTPESRVWIRRVATGAGIHPRTHGLTAARPTPPIPSRMGPELSCIAWSWQINSFLAR